MVKYSRQREAIKNQLAGRTDHPTAETIYAELKPEFPNLSVATVYRNLKQLEEWGELIRITTDGATRFDPNIEPHSHFFCRICGSVTDMPELDMDIRKLGQKHFAGSIEGCSANFYGICPICSENRVQ